MRSQLRVNSGANKSETSPFSSPSASSKRGERNRIRTVALLVVVVMMSSSSWSRAITRRIHVQAFQVLSVSRGARSTGRSGSEFASSSPALFSTSASSSSSSRFEAKSASSSLENESKVLKIISNDVEKSHHQITDEDVDISHILKDWRSHPSVNFDITFKTWIVPSPHIQKVLVEPKLCQYMLYSNSNPNTQDPNATVNLSSSAALLQHIHPRMTVVQKYDAKNKLVMWISDSEEMEPEAAAFLAEKGIVRGPDMVMPISYQQLSFSYIFSQLAPSDVPPPTAYEQIGHIAHFNLKKHHMPYGELIGQILVDIHPTIDTVVTKVGEVSGPYRTYDLKVLAGIETTETIHGEHGLSMHIDCATCYWSTRLSGERQVLLNEMKLDASSYVADVFCGVGTLCLLAHQDSGCRISANDWNPAAVDYFRKNVAENGMGGSFLKQHSDDPVVHLAGTPDKEGTISVQCGDAYDFMTDLGMELAAPTLDDRFPDHIVMNYPLEAPRFLGSLRWWSSKRLDTHTKIRGSRPRVHVYTFARGDKEGDSLRDEATVAVDIVANSLIPDFYSSSGSWRRDELNKEYECDVSTRVVRDVAPGKVVVCVSFSVTPRLIRHMQGDF